MQMIASELRNASHGKREAINVLEVANHADLPFDFDIIDTVTDEAFKNEAESFAIQLVEETLLFEGEKVMLRLKMDMLRSEKKNSLEQERLERLSESTDCEESMISEGRTR